MKITLGGSLGYKLQVAAYEPLEANSFLTIETEIDDFDEEKIAILEAKTNAILKAQINNKMDLAIKNYKEKIKLLKEKV